MYDNTTKDARMQAVADRIDSGSGAGVLQLATSSAFTTLLAEITLGDPCGTVASQALTLSGFPRSDTSANNSGTATHARIVTSGGTQIVGPLTVGTSGTHVVMDNPALVAGQQVTINSAVLTHF